MIDHLKSAIILAGGQSRRMGQPKPALRFGNYTILEGLIAKLRDNFDDIVVIAAPERAESFPIARLLSTAPSSVRLLRDFAAYQGAAVALARGLAAIRHEVAFACSCDLPLLQIGVVLALHGMLKGFEAVIPHVGGQSHPLCAFYRRTVATVLEKQLTVGERRLTRITAGLSAYHPGDLQLRKIDPELRSFINVNIPEDYNRALAIFSRTNP